MCVGALRPSEESGGGWFLAGEVIGAGDGELPLPRVVVGRGPGVAPVPVEPEIAVRDRSSPDVEEQFCCTQSRLDGRHPRLCDDHGGLGADTARLVATQAPLLL